MNNNQFLVFEELRKINKNFPKNNEIINFQKQGKSIIGWLCNYVPEELIHASGCLPIRITGYRKEVELDDGNAYMYINNCSFSRSCLQLGLRGEYNFLNGVVAGSTCDGARRLFDLWCHYIKPSFSCILTIPRKFTETAQSLYHQQNLYLKEHLEKFTGRVISDDDLRASVEVFNETRQLLKSLYELKKLENPPITGAQTQEIINAGYMIPKELYNNYLKQVINEFKNSGKSYNPRARLMVIGSIMDNPEFISSIEDLGALVVADELCTGTRYWADPIVLDGNSVLESISRRYLTNFPCARMIPSNKRFERIIELVKEYRVEGVISQIVRYCVPYAHDLPLLTEELRKIDVPVLALDVEYGTSGSGQIRTRVQAFLEMLEARRK